MLFNLYEEKPDTPEGSYSFKIVGVDKYGDNSLYLRMKTADGEYTHTEKYFFTTRTGGVNEFAQRNFTTLIRSAMNDRTLRGQFNTDSLVGKWIDADITWSEYNGKTTASLSNVRVCDNIPEPVDVSSIVELDDLPFN